MSRLDALALLSSGRDSLLSACLEIDYGRSIIPVICYNGHMEGIDRVQFSVQSLKDRYGDKRIGDLIQLYTGMTMHSYLLDFWTSTPNELPRELPLYQVHCLACKSAMYAHAIAYCKSHDIKYIIDGVRKSQGFFVDTEIMRNHFSALCAAHGIYLLTPIYELTSDLDRKRMLSEHGLPTKTLESQCFLGCPLKKRLENNELETLNSFYEISLQKKIEESIKNLAHIKWK